MKRTALVAVLAASLISNTATAAQQAAVQAKPAPAVQGLRAELIANIDDAEAKYIDLAEAVPANRYGWRPGKGVRSISEVFIHVAASNYFLATYADAKAPAGLTGDMEKRITAKVAVIAELKKSFDFLRGHIAGMTDAQLDKSVKMFDTRTTQRGVLLTIVSHIHEHLGQSIAYARVNGVVPPWSR